jgi:uncharacterized DUF497 family protein
MSGFDWDEANRAHIARHRVSVTEAEEAADGETLDLRSYMVDDEWRFDSIGCTRDGRILVLVTIDRAGLIRIVTAFDAPRAMRRNYIDTMVARYD